MNAEQMFREKLQQAANEKLNELKNDLNEQAVMSDLTIYPENQPVLVDVSTAVNSAQACQMVENFLVSSSITGKAIDLMSGNVLLTRNVLSKIQQQFVKNGLTIKTVFTSVPQTQQAALDEGFFVKEGLQNKSPRTRMAIPYERAAASDGIELPRFESKGTLEARVVDSIDEAMMDMLSRKNQPEQQTEVTPSVDDVQPVETSSVEEIFVEESLENVTPEESVNESALEPKKRKIIRKPASVQLESTVELEDYSDEIDVQEVIKPKVKPVTYNPSETGVMQSTEEVEPTFLYKQTLRSGQVLKYDGSIVILGDVHAGSEVIAGGDVVVWGELKGIAHAGCPHTDINGEHHAGNNFAEVRAMKVEAIQLRIGDFIARRPDRIYNHKQTESPFPKPEVARVADGEIKIFTELVN